MQKQELRARIREKTKKEGMAKMMLFLGAVASNPFGIKTLKEIEKQFENVYYKN